MKNSLSRRSFIKIGGAGTAGVLAAGGITKLIGEKETKKRESENDIKIPISVSDFIVSKDPEKE